MKDIIKELENKKMIHTYIDKFIEPNPNLINESKIKINESNECIIGSYTEKNKNPFQENINVLVAVSASRVLIDYRKSIIVENDTKERIIEKSESHIGAFELNGDIVDMTKVITNRTRSTISDKEEEIVVKKEYKFFKGEKNLLTNPYGIDDISLRIKRR